MYAFGPARQSMLLLAPDDDTLVTLEGGMIVRAWQAKNGKQRWKLKLAETGLIRGGTTSADGRTLAVFADTEGGRVFVIRDGKVINTLPVMADQVLLAPDGQHLAVVVANDLRWYATDGGLLWTVSGDDDRSVAERYQLPLHEPRISPDGKRVVFGTCTGMLYVLDNQGREVFQRDCGALPVANWLPGGDLLVATWMGDVLRLDASGATKWQVKLQPKSAVRSPSVADAVPISRMTWGNATEKPDPLTPNLLKEVAVQISTANDRPPYSPFGELENPPEILYDGRPTPPKRPWLNWSTVQIADSGWTGKWTLIFDFGKTNVHLTGVTVVEDPAHPRSWMRDVLLQYWDAQKGWLDGSYLLSDAATHTHHFEKPLEAAKFRLIGRDIKGWPVGNLQCGEIVFHGRPVAP